MSVMTELRGSFGSTAPVKVPVTTSYVPAEPKLAPPKAGAVLVMLSRVTRALAPGASPKRATPATARAVIDRLRRTKSGRFIQVSSTCNGCHPTRSLTARNLPDLSHTRNLRLLRDRPLGLPDRPFFTRPAPALLLFLQRICKHAVLRRAPGARARSVASDSSVGCDYGNSVVAFLSAPPLPAPLRLVS